MGAIYSGFRIGVRNDGYDWMTGMTGFRIRHPGPRSGTGMTAGGMGAIGGCASLIHPTINIRLRLDSGSRSASLRCPE